VRKPPKDKPVRKPPKDKPVRKPPKDKPARKLRKIATTQQQPGRRRRTTPPTSLDKGTDNYTDNHTDKYRRLGGGQGAPGREEGAKGRAKKAAAHLTGGIACV
jgi:hypothetical protein